MDTTTLALRLGLALAIGFVIGLERGWKERREKEGRRAAGIRTFSLVGLLGGVIGAASAGGDRLFLGVAFATLGAALGAYMWREGAEENDFSATSLIAALLTFALGAYAVLGDPRVAAGAAIAATILLASKAPLHGWLSRLAWPELQAGLLLGAMTFIALPLLPARAVDPWGALNPYELWLMTILIAAISFAGYAAVKIAGPGRGLPLAAALGGLFASTAVTLTLARHTRQNPGHARMLAGGVLIAGAVMLMRVLLVSGLINLPVALTLMPSLVAAAAAMAVMAFLFFRSDRGKTGDFLLRNPFDLPEVLRFGALLAVIMLAVQIVRQIFGDPGLYALAALSGLADADAMTLSVARLGPGSEATAALAILITVASNSLAKVVYATYAGGRAIGGWSLLGTLLAALAATVSWMAMKA
ncbi:MAG: MgtC/SapB family protein [Aestuariivirga sp.]